MHIEDKLYYIVPYGFQKIFTKLIQDLIDVHKLLP